MNKNPLQIDKVTRWAPLAPAADTVGWNLPDPPFKEQRKGKRRKRKKKIQSSVDSPSNRDEPPKVSSRKKKSRSTVIPECMPYSPINHDNPLQKGFSDIEKNHTSLAKGYKWDKSKHTLMIDGKESKKQNLYIFGKALIKLLKGSLHLFGYDVPIGSEVSLNYPQWNKSTIEISTIGESVLQINSISHGEQSTFKFSSGDEGYPMIISDSWKSSCDDVLSIRKNHQPSTDAQKVNARTLICGGKSVGKSSLLRYLSNRIICDRVSVAVLDCDVGQPEFSPPGMLTLTIVDSPLLSPPFLHMRKYHLESYFYGSNTSRDDPTTYLELITDLFSSYLMYVENKFSGDESQLPLIINTDGWVKGFGFEILTTIIDKIRPTHVLNLISPLPSKSMSLDLALPKLSTLVSVQGFPTPSTGTGINAHALRSMRLCTYFLDDVDIWYRIKADSMGIIDTECEIATTLSRMKPYLVSSENVCCGSVRSQSVDNEVLNGSIVGLLGRRKDKKVYCLGLGIVRGIQESLLYVLTPLPREKLVQVTNITRSSLQLPVECLHRGKHSDAFPYMCCRTKVVAAGGDFMSSRKNIGRKHQ
mmetsp:Transcript_26106/g.38622  ORF Transcript_26106/g.38622 Transcript_26106/m.38622 type:complete len:586 (+) Transcript_26106:129-1886(+)